MWGEIRRRLWLWDYVRRIRKYGWTATYIPESTEAAFSYSTGFWESANAPEIFMSSADPQMTNDVLHVAYAALKTGELVLADCQPWKLEWFDDPKLIWRAVHPSQIRREHLNLAIWYRERQGKDRAGLKVFQLVVSDRNGRFPWEADYDQNYRPRQTELYLPYLGPPDED